MTMEAEDWGEEVERDLGKWLGGWGEAGGQEQEAKLAWLRYELEKGLRAVWGQDGLFGSTVLLALSHSSSMTMHTSNIIWSFTLLCMEGDLVRAAVQTDGEEIMSEVKMVEVEVVEEKAFGNGSTLYIVKP